MKILLVDDDPDIRLLAATVLAREGFRVVELAGGEEVVERARRDPPDAVLLDLQLGDVDGLEVLRRLRDDPVTSEVPVIFLTGKGRELEEELGRAGARGVIAKPFDPGSLGGELRRILGKEG